MPSTLAGATLKDVRQHYKGANYPPDPECDACGGTGYNGAKKVISVGRDDVRLREVPGKYRPCMCLYVGDPKMRGIVKEGIRELTSRGA